jgi:hypothetical protein
MQAVKVVRTVVKKYISGVTKDEGEPGMLNHGSLQASRLPVSTPGLLFFFLFIIVRIQFFRAVCAQTVAEFGIGVLADVGFHLRP